MTPRNSYQRYHAAHGAEEVEYTWMPNDKPYITEQELLLVRYLATPSPCPVVIAGGAVVNSTSKDIDIWFLAGARRESIGEVVTQSFKDHPYHNYRFYERTEWTYKIPHMDKIGEHVPEDRNKRKLQWMVTEYEDVATLLANFDISTHAWACHLDGHVEAGPTATDVNEQPRVQVWDTPHSTLRRYITLCDRYHQKLHWQDVERLCERVVEVAAKQAQEKLKDLGV